MTFMVCQDLMPRESSVNFTCALGMFYEIMRDVYPCLVTNRDLAFMNTTTFVFPEAHKHMCRWHVGRCNMSKTKKLFQVMNWYGCGHGVRDLEPHNSLARVFSN